MKEKEAQKDPVCGMTVPPGEHFVTTYQGRSYYFCSELCQGRFLAAPAKFAAISGDGGEGARDTARRVAYFSMEAAVDSRIPTYSGGLGVLAGDTLKSYADLRIPAVAVSLFYAKGYFDQRLDEWGNQRELPADWNPIPLLKKLPVSIRVLIEGCPVLVQAWRFDVVGASGWVVPLILLDTDLEQNAATDRELTSSLYGGDPKYRFAQEIVLGIGGVRMLRALGYDGLLRFHMNEGHASLLSLELLREQRDQTSADWEFNRVRESCIFTTHTPVQAGHDRFSYELVKDMLEPIVPLDIVQMLTGGECLNMTLLGLNMSHYVNGVAKRHGQVSQVMFPGHPIDSITNGVHSVTWTCDRFRALYDRHIPGWRNDPSMLRHAMSIPKKEIWDAHVAAKERLLQEVRSRTRLALSKDTLTIGFARRATFYKRAALVFSDANQLREIAKTAGPIQFIYAGKAHPRTNPARNSSGRSLGLRANSRATCRSCIWKITKWSSPSS